MFFIFGSPRSGTTLLAQCLSANSQIIVPDETDFIVPASLVLDRIQNESLGRHLIREIVLHSTRYPVSIAPLIDSANFHDIIANVPYDSRIVTTIFDRIAELQGKKICGDKSPNDLLFAHTLFKQGFFDTGTKVVHIVRDIRDVIESLRRQEWASDDIATYFPRVWSSMNLELHCRLANRHNYRLVRYEDFVTDPGATLEMLCGFLEVDFEVEMLNPKARHERYELVIHHQKLFQPISSKWVGEHNKRLPAELVKSCEIQAWEALNVFGYGKYRKPSAESVKESFTVETISAEKVEKIVEKGVKKSVEAHEPSENLSSTPADSAATKSKQKPAAANPTND